MNAHLYKKTAREVALHLLSRVEKEGAYADRILTSPEVMNLNPRDRSFMREMLVGVLRWKLRLDRIIDMYYNRDLSKLSIDIRNVLRLGLFQMMFMDSVPEWAAVNESVSIASGYYGKGAGGLVNTLLRRFNREGEPDKRSLNPSEKRSFEFSHPLWVVRRWTANFSSGTAESIMKAGNEKHPVFIRPGRIGTGIDDLVEALVQEGFETAEVTGMPGYLAVSRGSGLFETAAFREGLFTVQDPSAAMASLLLSPLPGETVLDLCTAPGGKAIHLALLMQNSGHIRAVDKHVARLGLVKESAARLGLTSIECEVGDALTYQSGTEKQYDRVLIDVPCSGTGVFSKRPDLKWRITQADVIRLASLQQEMLHNAAAQVKPGGVLVYSTCTLEPEENENTVDTFLQQHSEFSVERDDRFTDFEKEAGYLILPHQMEGTGAFAAKLRRK